MQDTAVNPLVDQTAVQLRTLSTEDLHTVRDFVDYLAWKHRPEEASPAPKKSAEALAIERIPDLDDPTQWITVRARPGLRQGDRAQTSVAGDRTPGLSVPIPLAAYLQLQNRLHQPVLLTEKSGVVLWSEC